MLTVGSVNLKQLGYEAADECSVTLDDSMGKQAVHRCLPLQRDLNIECL